MNKGDEEDGVQHEDEQDDVTVERLMKNNMLFVCGADHKRPACVGPWGWQRPGSFGIHLLVISESKLI